MVSIGSMAVMGLNILFSIAVPVALLLVIRKKYKTAVSVFFIGAATFLVFAMVLEQGLHAAFFLTPAGKALQANIWLYALYGGLAAALFEETGRFLSMKFLLKKRYNNPYNSLMYGAGYGGCEMVMVFGTAMLNNLIYSVLINTGQTVSVMALLPEEQKGALAQVFDTLIANKPYSYLLGDVERLSALLLQIAFSVIMWIAVTKGKKFLIPMTYCLHFLVDYLTVVLANGIKLNILLVEVVILALAVCVALAARHFWKRYIKKGETV